MADTAVTQEPKMEINTTGQYTLLLSIMQTNTSQERSRLPQSTPDMQLVQREILSVNLDLTINLSKLEENHSRPISTERGCRSGVRMGNCSKS